ncbi:MAG: CHAD domain-containing protein [Terracidiphilus sp.]|jgi:CHAD domain-containing protein
MAEELERARKAVRELSKTLKSLPMDPPPEEIHKLRTTTRRVEAIVSVLGHVEGKESRRVLKSIEPIRKAAGGVREMDVMIVNARKLERYVAGDSLTRLLEHLQIARQQNAEVLRRVLGRRRDLARENLKQYSRLIRTALAPEKEAVSLNGLPAHLQEGVHSAAIKVVRELGEWPPLDADNVHAFRLKVKELRYILQLSADADSGLVETLGNVQRLIGDWHDWQQLEQIARKLLNMKRDGTLLTRIGETSRRRLSRALTAANALRGKYLTMPFAQGV